MASNPSRSEIGERIETFLVATIEEGGLHRQKKAGKRIELKQNFCSLRHFSTKHFAQLEDISTT
jgi:hypothetical protein